MYLLSAEKNVCSYFKCHQLRMVKSTKSLGQKIFLESESSFILGSLWFLKKDNKELLSWLKVFIGTRKFKGLRLGQI